MPPRRGTVNDANCYAAWIQNLFLTARESVLFTQLKARTMEPRQTQRQRRKRLLKQQADRIKSIQSNNDPKTGYFALMGLGAVCEDDACLITGSVGSMKHFISANGFSGTIIRPTTFSEIYRGMQLGGAYCFDEQAYQRFLKPGRAAGLQLADEDFSDPGPTGTHLLIVRPSTS